MKMKHKIKDWAMGLTLLALVFPITTSLDGCDPYAAIGVAPKTRHVTDWVSGAAQGKARVARYKAGG